MKVIIPQIFSPDMLVSTGFSETIPTWSGVPTYAVGDRVVFPAPSVNQGPTTISKIYECVDINQNSPPSFDSLFWAEVKTSNTYAMFDNTVNNQSISTNSNTLTIDLFLVNGISALSFINSEFGSVDIRIFDSSFGGLQKYRKSYATKNSLDFKNWLEYSEYTFVSGDIPIIFSDLVNIKNTCLRIVLTPNPETGSIKIGELVFGTLFEFGFTQRGVNSGIIDYSIKQTDEFGNINFVERNFSKRLNCSVLIKNSNLNASQRALYNLRAKPAVWIATEDANTQESTVVFGYYKDFSCELTYPEYSIYNIEVEGLI